jgi:hypothetical protein
MVRMSSRKTEPVSTAEIVRAGYQLIRSDREITGHSLRRLLGRGCRRRLHRVWREHQARSERSSTKRAFWPVDIELKFHEIEERHARSLARQLRRLAVEADEVRQRYEQECKPDSILSGSNLEVIDAVLVRAHQIRGLADEADDYARAHERMLSEIRLETEQREIASELPGALAAEMERMVNEARRTGLDEIVGNPEEAIRSAARRGGRPD